ncbi:helix-turn-helix domain-containing protein [Flavobacterium sp.]|uniref:helix-turn-helix domain-containing protein n=1 Tax=Flavobacterium sp. TaxID=239 RepID=UPI00260C1B6C|nr:helix-turn-helix domain-containing protein [Flavobacterium sp.]
MDNFLRIKSISQLHKMIGYEKPKHPLITIIDYSKVETNPAHYNAKIVTDFYIISLKTPSPKSLRYGRQYYDFEEGTMMFMAPDQVFSVSELNEQIKYEGWGIYFHPDLIINSSLGKRIKEFQFFSYAVSEALHLSEEEKNTLTSIAGNIQKEYNGNIDKYSQGVIITAIEQLLNYSQRFYGRQFITRQKLNSDLLSTFEKLVFDYFNSSDIAKKGLPSVDYFSNKLNLSTSYLADLLKKETGKTTKEFLQIQIIEKAKNKLLNSTDTVNEIAYSLGFEYPQYFYRLFKTKTGMTPVEYRQIN